MSRYMQVRKRRRVEAGARRARRRGAVVVQVAIAMTALMGFSALAIDVSMMYNARTELQRAADAAALAAASALGDYSQGSPLATARQLAAEFANANTVLTAGVQLDTSDVVFGRATINPATGKYEFTETETFPNAVRVRARRTDGSPSGAVPLFFANIFGISSTDIAAQATAVLVPRDIVFVLDLSASHNDDSSLRSYKAIQIDNFEVWRHLKDVDLALSPKTDSIGFTSSVSVMDNGDGTSRITVNLSSDGQSGTPALSHVTFGLPASVEATALATATSGGGYPVSFGVDPTTGVLGLKFDETALGEGGVVQTEWFSFSVPNESLQALNLAVATKAGGLKDTSVQYNLAPGPLLGNMNTWGTATTGPGWDFAADPGLVRLPKGSAWTLTSAFASQTLLQKGYGQYTSSEMSVINSSSYDSDTAAYRRRVRVALGLDRWKSGKTGGQAGGNGDNKIDASEVETLIPYPSASSNPGTFSKKVGGSWDNFIDYVINSGSGMCQYNPDSGYYGDPGLRYRFGLKTWIDYLQEKQVGNSASPGFAGAPTQPMGAVADATKLCMEVIEELDGDDRVGMASYGTYGYGPADKPANMSWLVEDYDAVRGKVDTLQAGMWTSYTNIAQGIDKGRQVLLAYDHGARREAAKVMILLTDGNANQTRVNPTYDEAQARIDTELAAQDAAAQGIQIHTVSVGYSADQELMQSVAQIGRGEWFHAEGSIATYRAQLETIFRALGGKRPVILIQ